MQESEPTRRKDEMIALCNAVGDLVADLCDVHKSDIFSKSKASPLPICRGICWYAMRIAFEVTYNELANITSLVGEKYTSAGISASVGQAIGYASRSPHWHRVWEKVKATLPTKSNTKDKGNGIVIQIVVPKGTKDHIKFEIKERIGDN